MIEPILIHANALHIALPDDSVHCIITSPPYWEKRSYAGVEPSIWGGNPTCEHDWNHQLHRRRSSDTGKSKKQASNTGANGRDISTVDATCTLCGAWFGCLGNEPTPQLFSENIALIGRELWRVLRPEGTLWINIGDSFLAKATTSIGSNSRMNGSNRTQNAALRRHDRTAPGLKLKNLAGIPWLVAQAMQRTGWIWRRELPWLKRNPMPEETRDRPVTSHEYWLMFVKQRKYYYDIDAIRVPQAGTAHARGRGVTPKGRLAGGARANNSFQSATARYTEVPGGRAWRSMDAWMSALDKVIEDQQVYLAHLLDIRNNGGVLLDDQGDPLAMVFNAQGYHGEHYAAYNPTMIEPLIKASTSEAGCCAQCGKPWVRVTKSSAVARNTGGPGKKHLATQISSGQTSILRTNRTTTRETLGWKPGCRCNAGDPVPCTVLDPFAGTGSTLLTARALGRRAIGMDASGEYLTYQARHRLSLDALAGKPRRVQDLEQDAENAPLFFRGDTDGN